MFVARIVGGLGNQMFEYAAARRLAVVRGADLFLDLTSFTAVDEAQRDSLTYHSHDGSWRALQLCHFNINARMIRPVDVLKFLFLPEGFLAHHKIRGEEIPLQCDAENGKMPGFLYEPRNVLEFLCCWLKDRNHVLRLSKRFLGEQQYHFDRNVVDAADNRYMMGYWESEQYFSDIRETLLTDFTLREPLTGRNLEYKRQIEATESVSIHVRRGDALRPLALKKWKLLEPAYFLRSAQLMAARVTAPHFFVFSNDIPWAKANVELPFPSTFIEGNNEDTSFIDLELMRNCKHNIIANSSFSWWGAWLNRNKDKIVCAPATWFNEFAVDTSSLIPEGWIRVPNE